MSSTPIERVQTLPTLPRRALDSNKGDNGKVLLVVGSRGMSGAAVLCGSAALRAGAGLVRVAVPGAIQPEVAAGNPCYTTIALPHDSAGRLAVSEWQWVPELAARNDVVACGPGLDRSPSVQRLVGEMISTVTTPLVLDADGLNNLSERDNLQQRPGPTILTPHPGEFARVLGIDIPAVLAQRQELAVEFAQHQRVILLLKGHRTLITDGHRLYENRTGNPGMATGGSGDVLTGVIAALLGQGLEPFAAAQLGAYVHGLAGDLARRTRGDVGLIATDLIEHLPEAFAHL